MHWLSLCLLILVPTIALTLVGYFNEERYLSDYLESFFGFIFIALHLLISIVQFILTTLIMMFSIPHTIILVPAFCAPLVPYMVRLAASTI